MTPQASADPITNLKTSRDSLLESLAGISEADARKSSGPGCWSALDCVEHLTIAEETMLGRIKNGEALPEPIHLPEREARMVAAVAGRVTKVQAPPAALPAGRFASIAEAIEGFITARARTIEFLETDPDLRGSQAMHPFFGAVSGYEMALIMASHAVRHALQIREIREQIE